MKFGRDYHKSQIAEWADAYVNYAALKRLWKDCRAKNDVREFVVSFSSAVESVNLFYCSTQATLLSNVSSIPRRQGSDQDPDAEFPSHFACDGLSSCESRHKKRVFVKLAEELGRLRWYGHVNTDAFERLIRKVRSSGAVGSSISTRIEGSLYGKEFKTQYQSLKVLGDLQQTIALITQAQENIATSPCSAHKGFQGRLARVDSSIPALPLLYDLDRGEPLDLEKLIDNACGGQLAFSRGQFFKVLFQYSIRFSSRASVDVIISRAHAYDSVGWIESCLRDVIVELCWTASEKGEVLSTRDRLSSSLLAHLLDRLIVEGLDLLFKPDDFGQIPLHYACEGGSVGICELVLKFMTTWRQSDRAAVQSAILLEDSQKRNPLQLSLFSGHLDVTKTLIHFYNEASLDISDVPSQLGRAYNELLLFAARTRFSEAVACLLDFDVDVNCSDAFGQTPLYLAARSGNMTLVELLLRHGALVDKAEIAKGWSPLIIASSEGNSDVAKMLLKHRAQVEHRDCAGWSAIDHACYRGHISLSKALSGVAEGLAAEQVEQLQDKLQAPAKQKAFNRGQPSRNCSATESNIIVNIGSLDSSDTAPAVSLSSNLTKNALDIHPESLFSLDIWVAGAPGLRYTVRLPLLKDAPNTPYTFTVPNAMDAKLVFNLFRAVPLDGEDRNLIGRGMSLLDSFKKGVDMKRESISRDFSVAIMSTDRLEYLGTVVFSFIISTPLTLPSTPPVNTETLWSENGHSKIVGHRGLGQNLPTPRRLQVGENTIESFLSAAHLGASYVEESLQELHSGNESNNYYSSDHVPVVYHDFLVSEVGIDAPMQDITFEQFMHISNEQSDQRLSTISLEEKKGISQHPLSRKTRRLSLSSADTVQMGPFMSRIKHTFDYNSRGFKGNIRGDFINGKFVTLEQLLRKLPQDIALDIELKYPIFSEATDDWKMDPFFVEANFFTDSSLQCLAQNISGRAILLSSFSPEICILLARKQSRWPIFFGTDSGNWQPTDVRATSLQEAVSFANMWELDGIVLASEPFVFAPQLVGYVKGKGKGMVTATYGEFNDQVEGVKIQAVAGVDAIIVNDVRKAVETLAAISTKNQKDV